MGLSCSMPARRVPPRVAPPATGRGRRRSLQLPSGKQCSVCEQPPTPLPHAPQASTLLKSTHTLLRRHGVELPCKVLWVRLFLDCFSPNCRAPYVSGTVCRFPDPPGVTASLYRLGDCLIFSATSFSQLSWCVYVCVGSPIQHIIMMCLLHVYRWLFVHPTIF